MTADFQGMNPSLIPRSARLEEIRAGLAVAPIVALLGPRQCGKTTLSYALQATQGQHFDLEEPSDFLRLEESSDMLAAMTGVVVIDEIQRLPALFPRLRVWADRHSPLLKFLITGSASFDLIQGVSESLAGRVRLVKLSGFDLNETGAASVADLWLRGGFPRSYLAVSEIESWRWRRDFVETFLTRDLPQLRPLRHPPALLRRFWTMLAHYHGQSWNAQEAAGSLGLNVGTVNRYLQLMADAYMIRLLPPWSENLGKRIRKTPKVYLRDSGIAHYLLNIRTEHELLSHPRCGASWEGFVIEQILRHVEDESRASFWGTHGGAELDLLLDMGTQRIGFEIKRSDAPGTTKSMRSAIQDLKLTRLYVVHPGTRRYELDGGIELLPAMDLGSLMQKLGAAC
jgi:uncharacterized protein